MTSTASADLKPLAITMGDAAGIGPEIIAKAYRDDAAALQGCFVVGDVATLRRAAQVVAPHGRLPLPVACITQAIDALQAPPHCIPVLQPRTDLGLIPWGQVSGAAGAFAGDCVVWTARAALNGSVGAMVTAPLHKEALHAAGLPFADSPVVRFRKGMADTTSIIESDMSFQTCRSTVPPESTVITRLPFSK